jgi:unspecific monooxygenase
MDRIRLTDEDDPLLEAICRESLRLNPPFIGGFRYVAEPLTLAGIRFEPGSLILPNPASAHRNPRLYPDPHRFRPERFLERSFAAHEYAPFGGGDRRCVAERMALDLMRLILRSVATAFELRPARPWSCLERQEGLLLVPRDRLPVRLRRRKP